MHIVIMGCGRVGSTLAHILEDRGYTVAVIDQDPEAFRRLRPSFKGDRVTGVGFDRDVLARAGIERADGFAAVSSGDNSNIIAARVARETFAVRQVAARIYDPRRAEVYERLGIPTVATVRWTADQMLRKLLPGSGAGAALAGRHRQAGADPGDDVAQVDRRADQAGRDVGRGPRSPTSTGSARRWCRRSAPCSRRATWCTSSPGRATSTGSWPRLPRVTGVSTDAGRNRRRGRGGQVHRPRAA